MRGKAGGGENGEDMLGTGRGLRGGFQDKGVARKESGYKGVDEDEVGVLGRMSELLISICMEGGLGARKW